MTPQGNQTYNLQAPSVTPTLGSRQAWGVGYQLLMGIGHPEDKDKWTPLSTSGIA